MRIEFGRLNIEFSVWLFVAVSWALASVAWAWAFVVLARNGYPPPWAAGGGKSPR